MGLLFGAEQRAQLAAENKQLTADNVKLAAENIQLKEENAKMREYIAQRQEAEQRGNMRLNQQWQNFWNYDGTPQGGNEGTI